LRRSITRIIRAREQAIPNYNSNVGDSVRVVVVGAGPAGSSAATFLARAGAQVTLLERAHFPRDKVCGDGCTPRGTRMLNILGAADLPARHAAPVDAFFSRSPAGYTVDAPLPAELYGGKGFVIPRTILDEHLVRVATRAGAQLREGAHVEAVEAGVAGAKVRLRGGEVLDAEVVLGCDGSPSVARRSAAAPDFSPSWSAFALRVYYDGVVLSHPRAFGLFWEKELLPGYAWIFPLPQGRANVGVGMRADLLGRAKVQLPELLDRFCGSAFGRRELAGGRRLGKPLGHHLPFGGRVAHVTFDRLLLLGDAAGFVNPLTGEGIELALESGQLAAETIAEAAAAGDFSARGLAGYTRRCRERFETSFRLNGRLMQMFQHPRVVDRVARAAQDSRGVQVALASVMLGASRRLPARLWLAAALGL